MVMDLLRTNVWIGLHLLMKKLISLYKETDNITLLDIIKILPSINKIYFSLNG